MHCFFHYRLCYCLFLKLQEENVVIQVYFYPFEKQGLLFCDFITFGCQAYELRLRHCGDECLSWSFWRCSIESRWMWLSSFPGWQKRDKLIISKFKNVFKFQALVAYLFSECSLKSEFFSVALVSRVERYLVALSYMNPVDVPAAFQV